MPMSMKSDTFFRGFKRPKRGFKRPKPDTSFKRKPELSPYDAIEPPLDLETAGGVPIYPLPITESGRPRLIRFSQLALEFYIKNQEEGSGVDATFEFHDLVKCTYWSDYRPRKHGDSRPRSPSKCYITFKAKANAKGDPSSSPDIIVFQAKISIDREDHLPVVKECHIKI